MKALAFRFHEIGRYSAFVRSLSEHSNTIKDLGYVYPQREAFADRIAYLQNQFDSSQRQLLIERLLVQHQSLGWTSIQNQYIQELASADAFVVSTAHQPSFLGGPAYIPVKIASSIALCHQLKQWFPEFQFIPIHWLGSEDHDFDELGHVNLLGQTFQWQAQAGGPIGRKTMGDLAEIWSQLATSLHHKPYGRWALDTLEQAFQPEVTLSMAMRTWLNSQFSEHGLLILDGDDLALKHRFTPLMQREFRESFAWPALQQGAKRFEQAGFEPPLQGRAINLFHLTDTHRDRLEPDQEGKWSTKSGDLLISREEGADLVAQNPNEWSPNAVLRPLYQELIIPEIAFVGGGAEIAYWTQLQETFLQAGLQQPLLVLRSSLGWSEANTWKKAIKAGFQEQWLQHHYSLWEANVLQQSGLEVQNNQLRATEQQIEQLYQQIVELAQSIDPSLTGAVESERQKTRNGLENIKGKVRKAYKQKQEVQLRQLKTLYERLFPNNKLQEREESLLFAFAQWGPQWTTLMVQQLNPVQTEFLLLVEEESGV